MDKILSIYQYQNDELDIEKHFNYLDRIFDIKKTWPNWQVNEDGSFYIQKDIPDAFASNANQKQVLALAKDFIVKAKEKVTQLIKSDTSAAYLQNIFKFLKQDKVEGVIFRKGQKPNHFDVYFTIALPATKSSIKLNDGKSFQPLGILQDAYVKLSIGAQEVLGLSYIAPVFTKSSLQKTAIDNDFDTPFQMVYHYNSRSLLTQFNIANSDTNTFVYSNVRPESQRLLYSDSLRYQTAATLLHSPTATDSKNSEPIT